MDSGLANDAISKFSYQQCDSHNGQETQSTVHYSRQQKPSDTPQPSVDSVSQQEPSSTQTFPDGTREQCGALNSFHSPIPKQTTSCDTSNSCVSKEESQGEENDREMVVSTHKTNEELTWTITNCLQEKDKKIRLLEEEKKRLEEEMKEIDIKYQKKIKDLENENNKDKIELQELKDKTADLEKKLQDKIIENDIIMCSLEEAKCSKLELQEKNFRANKRIRESTGKS